MTSFSDRQRPLTGNSPENFRQLHKSQQRTTAGSQQNQRAASHATSYGQNGAAPAHSTIFRHSEDNVVRSRIGSQQHSANTFSGIDLKSPGSRNLGATKSKNHQFGVAPSVHTPRDHKSGAKEVFRDDSSQPTGDKKPVNIAKADNDEGTKNGEDAADKKIPTEGTTVVVAYEEGEGSKEPVGAVTEKAAVSPAGGGEPEEVIAPRAQALSGRHDTFHYKFDDSDENQGNDYLIV